MDKEVEKDVNKEASDCTDIVDAGATAPQEPVEMIECMKCGQIKPVDTRNRHMCVDCAKAENSRYTYYRQHQEDWIALAKESQLDLWLQQPGETQWEYTVWCAYRDSYPGKRPTYSQVAEQLCTTKNVVAKIGQRWNFSIRMQAWMTEVDRITLLQRRQEILDMNKEHVDMASRLRQKLSTAIDNIDPELIKPSEIASLARVAEEIERKARLDTIAQEEMRKELTTDLENAELKKAPTKQSDLSEVVSILMKAGALGDVAQVGVRQVETKTTEVVVKDSNGNMSTMEMED